MISVIVILSLYDVSLQIFPDMFGDELNTFSVIYGFVGHVNCQYLSGCQGLDPFADQGVENNRVFCAGDVDAPPAGQAVCHRF